MKRSYYLLPILMIAVMVAILLPMQTTHAADLCDLWETISVMGGEYTIQNNVWGATTAQCINVPDTNSNSFSVSLSNHNQGSVASYPSVYKGCHWGDCTVNSGMPIPVNQVGTAPFSWSVNTISSGTWNVAAEAWFSANADSSDGYDGGAELMIWLDYQGMQPAGSQVGTANIGGASWEVWYSNIGWNYIAYRRIGATSSVNLDLKAFIDDSVSRGYINSSWYLHDLEAGFELMSGGTGLTSNDFSFTVNGSGPQPSLTPTTSMPPTVVPPTPLPPTQQPGGCTVDYTIQNQWNSGATVSVTIGNGSSSAINGWTLAWTFPGNQQINQMWGGSYTQSGANVSVSNVSWNSTIPANGTAGFGFGLTYSGTNTIPTNFALNGVPCNGSTPPPTQVPPTSIPPTSIPPTSIPPTSVPPTSVPPTSIPPTTVPPTTVPPTQQPGTCSVDYVIQNDWGSGATVTVTVRNGSSSAINGWTLTWTFPGNQQITNLWNGSYTQSGASVSVRDAGWNATIGANGGTVSFGFNLNYNGTNGTPTNFALNGTACQ